MLALGNAESRRACALVVALDSEDITLNEFRVAVELLSPEMAQVMATMISVNAETQHDRRQRVHTAGEVCRRYARAYRPLN